MGACPSRWEIVLIGSAIVIGGGLVRGDSPATIVESDSINQQFTSCSLHMKLPRGCIHAQTKLYVILLRLHKLGNIACTKSCTGHMKSIPPHFHFDYTCKSITPFYFPVLDKHARSVSLEMIVDGVSPKEIIGLLCGVVLVPKNEYEKRIECR